MHKIDGPTANNDDEFTEGNPGTGTPATRVAATWLNSVQRELVAIVEAASITLDANDDNQVLEAIQALVPTSVPSASTTVPGKVELATNAETQTGTDALRAVTPASLASLTATETRAGLVELATTGEATTGTDTVRAVTPAGLKAAINALINGAPGALDTLQELAAALGNDANYASTVTTALAGKQPLDATLTGIAALTGAANKLIYGNGVDTFALTDFTAFARTLLDDADAATMHATLGTYTAAAVATTNLDSYANGVAITPNTGVTNTPPNYVQGFHYVTTWGSSSYKVQRITPLAGATRLVAKEWVRTYNGSAWSTWRPSTGWVDMPSAAAASAGNTWTGIPDWATQIRIRMRALSTAGATPVTIAGGSGGAVATSGYNTYSHHISTTTVGGASSITAWPFTLANAANAYEGEVVLSRVDEAGLTWICTGMMSAPASNATNWLAGSLALGAVLDTVAILPGGGTFDAGNVSMSYQ